MKKYVPFVVMFMLLGLFSPARAFDTMASSKNYRARMTFVGGDPIVGVNRLRVVITDKAGRVVKDALVGIEYLMPSLPGKKPMMDYRTTARLAGSSYQASLDLTMAGEWKIILTVATPPKRSDQMTFGVVLK
jgi:hypothetical protein